MNSNHLICLLVGIAIGAFLAKSTSLPIVGKGK